jgi:hypothetical protein
MSPIVPLTSMSQKTAFRMWFTRYSIKIEGRPIIDALLKSIRRFQFVSDALFLKLPFRF